MASDFTVDAGGPGMTPKRRRARAMPVVRDLLANGLSPADIHRGLEVRGLSPDSRGTTYNWVEQVRAEMALDGSGPWSLANDTTGRPRVVLGVLGARYRRYAESMGGPPTEPLRMSVRDAWWAVRIADAAPGLVPPDGAADPDDAWLRLWEWVLRYMTAEAAMVKDGTRGPLDWLDADLAREVAGGSVRPGLDTPEARLAFANQPSMPRDPDTGFGPDDLERLLTLIDRGLVVERDEEADR